MLRQLVAHRFRNLEQLDWRLERPAGIHLLLGGTGAGKTSLLEAVYVVATTRSFRTPDLVDCARASEQGSPGEGLFVAAEVEDRARRSRLELSWSATEGLRRRRDGDRTGLAEHLDAQPVLSWSSADVEMLLGVPALRRRFLDRGLAARRPAALAAYGRYRRVLHQKRALLRQGRCDRRAVESWNRLLSEAAAEVASLRAGWSEDLGRALDGLLADAGLPVTGLEVRYRPSPAAALTGDPVAIERALAASLERELATGRPLLGPHRDRVGLLWRGRDVARVASAGERKALGLALLCAQCRVLEGTGREPLLLIDDADAELDRTTLERVIGPIAACPQVLLSSNRPEAWRGLLEAHRWHLVDGRLDGG